MVMANHFIPDRGDVVWINMQPQAGHKQSGRRPAIVLSPKIYNDKTNLALLCPITNQIKGYPFEVNIPSGLKFTGVVLADQVKSLDWKSRKAEFCAKAPEGVIFEILQKLKTLLNYDE
jgi:mRNA interferase MazF